MGERGAMPTLAGRRGVGCGWAFQTAEWLVDATAEALRDGDVDAAQSRLAKQHRAGCVRTSG